MSHKDGGASVADDGQTNLAIRAEDGMTRAYCDLDKLATLAPNWDSYGSDPPTERARELARTLLETIAKQHGWRASGRIEPFTVGALPGSGVLLEWRGDDASLEVDIGPDGEIGYLFVDRRGGERRVEEVNDVPISTVLVRLATILTLRA